jgi:uncharacterized membrane protein
MAFNSRVCQTGGAEPYQLLSFVANLTFGVWRGVAFLIGAWVIGAVAVAAMSAILTVHRDASTTATSRTGEVAVQLTAFVELEAHSHFSVACG